MYIFLIVVIVIFFLLAIYNTIFGKSFVDFIRFVVQGRKKDFSYKDLSFLWRLASALNKEQRVRFFSSAKTIDFCIKALQSELDRVAPTFSTTSHQNQSHDFSKTTDNSTPKANKRQAEMTHLLTKLYNYRTRFEIELKEEQYHIKTTSDIEARQVCMLLSEKVGSIYIRIEEVGKDSIRCIMFDSSASKASKHKWHGDYAQVYFWRKGDAGYFFISKVLSGKAVKDGYEILISHSSELRRTQKRKSIRAACRFDGALFPLHSKAEFNEKYEKKGGINCKIRDISESGAMLHVKGKAERGVNIKLQFKIKNKKVVMCGSIVRFIYDEASNTSKVHFNATRVSEDAHNIILSFVYNIIEGQRPDIASSLFADDEEI